MSTRKPGRPKGSKTKDREERRLELIETAVAAVRRAGPDVSMIEIAAEAGVTKAVLYDHFESKEALQKAVGERYDSALMALLDRGIEADRTPLDVLRDGVNTFVAFIERDRAVFRFIARGNNEGVIGAAPVFSRLIGQSLRNAGKDSGGAEVFAHATLGAVFAATEHWAEQPTMTRADFVTYLTDMLWTGLAGVGLSATTPVDMAPAIDAVRTALEE